MSDPVVLPTTLGVAVPKLRSVPEAEARRMNTLVGERREFPFKWADKTARMHFVPATVTPAPRGWIRLRVGDASVDLGVPALPEPSSLGPKFAGIELTLLPEELLLGVLEVWLEEPLAVAREQGVAVQLEGWQTAMPSTPAACGWEIAWDDRDRFLCGTLHAEPEALGQLANVVHRAAPRPWRAADALPVTVTVSLGSVALPASSVRELRPGDAVLVPLTPSELAAGRCELWSAGRPLAHAVREQSKIKIVTMNNVSEPSSTPLAPVRGIDDLPVNLVFDVGQIQLSVGQLRTVGEGYTFELPEAVDRSVAIRANGREVGRGEIVEIGEKLAVRIVTWELA